MATLNLLNLNVDTLFEQHSVIEIDTVHKKIQEVVENKREELRTMVGERYRDLLKAADTIAAMQESTKALITQVDNINGNCKNLNEQQLLGFKTETDSAGELKTRNANKQLNNYFSTMIQIKLLTSLPELIWSQLDHEHYYAATELFIFSRHISTGLQLDSNNPVMLKLPVAKKQWEIIKPFHMTIKHKVMVALERENLGPDLTVDCILSLLQLERCTLESALKTFLNLRCTAFLNCLNADGGRVKERILSSLRVLNDSLDMVAKCFLDKSPLFTKLAEYSDPNAPPTIVRMDSGDVQFAHLLPDIILNYKPKFDAVTLNNEAVRLSLEQFLTDTQRIASSQLKQLFDLVTQMNSIQEIKTEANNLRKQLNLNTLTAKFQLTQPLDFYELRYVPLINQRVRNIINDSWSKTINETSTNLESYLRQPEILNNKNYSLWQEFPTDLPNSLDHALNDDSKIKKLLMKSKGYNDQIIGITTKFDENLAGIIKEMNIFLEEPTAKLEDKQALVEFLKDTAQQHITEFIAKVKSLQLDITDRQSLLFVARCCCALIELCPHLKMCFCQSSNWRQLLGTTASSTAMEYWQRICGLMEDEIYQFWVHIIKSLLQEFNCGRYLAKIDTCNVILEDFTHWELITLDQKDDQDMPVQSSFRVPTQPRISLQSYLQILITSLKEIIPETMPTKVLNTFNHKLIDELLKHYQQLLKDEPTLTQNIALQLYFDIKFLQSSFNITREQKEHITTLQNAYKELIDPFDFELFSSQLMANIKRSVLRSNCLLGVLTPLNVQTSQTGAVVQEKDPNVLSLCSSGSTSLWFPLLPVVTNTTNMVTSTSSSFEIKKTSLNESPKDYLFET
ncbi:conserved oligomeric Golgi complex subunit 1 isoform X2 [Calliphora vicina]|uniref:conserved oligomeric Golgi complex subunit 1 isoform X2 n=1 Tax=Calliphora vicina TaxID=7373 RepID=UPI00325AB645